MRIPDYVPDSEVRRQEYLAAREAADARISEIFWQRVIDGGPPRAEGEVLPDGSPEAEEMIDLEHDAQVAFSRWRHAWEAEQRAAAELGSEPAADIEI